MTKYLFLNRVANVAYESIEQTVYTTNFNLAVRGNVRFQ